jgi:hypothetical protein
MSSCLCLPMRRRRRSPKVTVHPATTTQAAESTRGGESHIRSGHFSHARNGSIRSDLDDSLGVTHKCTISPFISSTFRDMDDGKSVAVVPLNRLI